MFQWYEPQGDIVFEAEKVKMDTLHAKEIILDGKPLTHVDRGAVVLGDKVIEWYGEAGREMVIEYLYKEHPITQTGREKEMIPSLLTSTWIMIAILAFVIAKFVVPKLTLRYVLRKVYVRVKQLKDEWKKAKVS